MIRYLCIFLLLCGAAHAQNSTQGQYNSGGITLSTKQYAPLQLDSSGNLFINCATGCSGGGGGGNVNVTQWDSTSLGAPSNYGTSPGAVTVPGMNAFVTNTAAVNLTQVDGSALGAPSNYGTSPGAVAVAGVNAFVTNLALAIGSTTSGQTGVLAMAATTTAPPSNTTADTNPLSTDLNGGLRLNPACTGVINITQTATTDVHTFTHYGYICSILLVSATAQSLGVDEGTGTTCETSGTALIGVSSTSAATPTLAIAANGGFQMVSGIPLMKLQASADHLCVLQSSTGNVSGTITYADLTN